MTTGLARSAVRARPAVFGGVFAALTLSATVVTASVTVFQSASAAPPSPARSLLTEMGILFTLVTVYLSVFVIAQVMALAVAQRTPETALLRAVGATPAQVRRMVAAETLLTALPALPAGWLLGRVLAGIWWQGMADHGMTPAGAEVTTGVLPPLVAAGVLVVTSQLGGLLAARRAARSRPALLLGEARTPRDRAPVVRLLLAGTAAAGGCALTFAAKTSDNPGEKVPLILIAYLVAVGLAGPALGRCTATLLAGPLRLVGGGMGELAATNSRGRSHRLSPAITPVALMVAFSLVKFAHLATQPRIAWIDVFGTALYGVFAALVAANTLVMLTAERRREIALLRAVGAQAGQILRLVLAECCIVATAGFGAGLAMALAVSLPLGSAAGSLGALPPAAWAGTAAAVLTLVTLASTAPLALSLRPIEGRPQLP
ncbi:FtsX-like permease family protein [Streptomyces indicus]|uniref:Putative ABC transport system permease protein n=1 Tax=Streptomyces indicus TaxID=417292 RepID=A0A1G8XN13_9ACTN|nr:ABC transporter permease [Streptomyces indicus]SDJ91816.1 putative ABC transport system permease protein [Streptomyces indicus]